MLVRNWVRKMSDGLPALEPPATPPIIWDGDVPWSVGSLKSVDEKELLRSTTDDWPTMPDAAPRLMI